MINYPEIEQLRRLDPVPEPPQDAERAESLLHQLLAEPRTRAPRSRRRIASQFGAGAIAAASAIAAAAIGLTGISGAPSLVARAYAAVSVGGQVLHEVDITDDPGAPGFDFRVEGWLLPAAGRARVIDTSGYERARYVDISEWIITATGRVFGRTCRCRSSELGSFINGRALVGRRPPLVTGWTPENGPAISQGTMPGTFARWFRAAYRAHAIVPDGTTTFEGRRVARFRSMLEGLGPTNAGTMVLWRPGTAPPASARRNYSDSLIDWYVDPATGRPVGFRDWYCPRGQTRSCEGPPITTRIATFHRLDRTPANLAELTDPSAPPGAR